MSKSRKDPQGHGNRRHDAAYKRLFSHPEVVADLLREWIAEPWARQADLRTLRRVPSEFVTSVLGRRLSDCVWKFELNSGERICLLLEFQSGVDRWMALRMMVYVGQLHETGLRMNKKPRFLSRIASAVVYNGSRNWDAARDISSLFEGAPPGDSRFFGQLRYLLVDGEGAEKREDLVGLLFSLERAGEKEFRPLVERLARRLEGAEHAELRRSFRVWLNDVLLRKRIPRGPLLEIEVWEDDMIHLPERMTWTEEARLEGLQEGLEKGLERGLEKGRLDLAQSIFRRRFGPLSDEQLKRLDQADPDQLAIWVERSLSCRTLDEVLEVSE